MRGSAATAVTVAILALAAGATADVRRTVLPNGVTVLVSEDPGSGVVAAELHVRMAAGDETLETAGITRFLQGVVLRGTSRRSARRIAEAAEEIGGTLEASGDAQSAEIHGTALAGHWESLLELIADVALNPMLPPDEVDRERRLLASRIRARDDNPPSAALDLLLQELYGPHPFGAPSLGRRESVERLTRDDLARHHAVLYRPDRLVLAVSGDIDGRRVLKTAERLLGRVPPGAPSPRAAIPPPRPAAGRTVVERASHQSHIILGYLAPGVGAADYAATKVLVAILGGTAGRLSLDLREQLALAYSVGVLAPWRTGPAYIAPYVATAPENTETAEARLREQIARIRDGDATEAELARAKAFVTGALLLDRRTNARQAWYLGFFEAIGAGWDFPDRYLRAVEAVTLQAVHAAAQRYLVEPTTVVLRPAGR